jgi:hypothetical protein
MPSVLDLFCGLKGWSQPFADAGWDVTTLDNEPSFAATITEDVRDYWPEPGEFDVILASPPCESFSTMSFGTHWKGGWRGYVPATNKARWGIQLVKHTVDIIENVKPHFWVIENPRAMLRRLNLIPAVPVTVWYCRYGEDRAKPTDLWGGFPPSWVPQPQCHNGHPDHIRAPRGSRTGTQGGLSAAERAKIPFALAESIRIAAELDMPKVFDWEGVKTQ